MESIGKIFGENERVMSQVAVVNSLVPMKDRDEGNDWNRILLDRQFLNYPIVLSTHRTALKLDCYKLIKNILEEKEFVPFSLKEGM